MSGAERDTRLTLFGATMVGIGAMVGAGIFVLCGVAMDRAGPAAILAFTLNGVLALLTAVSFAELSSAFPESGGSYVFAKKVFPIGGAFAAGWVLWFAYVVACALYSLGFASFVAYAADAALGLALPGWFAPGLAVATTATATWILATRGAGAGNWISVAKLVAFVVLIATGLAVLGGRPSGTAGRGLAPFFPLGVSGVIVAMGFTFIALEGFEVIAAIGEEIKNPEKVVPRAMFLSIGVTMVVYTGLMFVVLTVGGDADGTPAWRTLGDAGDAAMATAARNFGGAAGAAVVVVAGLLSTFSALSSTLLAASRVAFSMARDRALPRDLAALGGPARTPIRALVVSGGIAAVVVVATADVEVAGAAASLIFLLSFGLTNAAGLLVRFRVGAIAAWKAPFYPALPLVGIAACLSLAVFQAVVVPPASLVALVWLAVGAVLYRLSFGARARTVSARSEAWDADLVRLRGRTPLVLVPMANPERAEPLLRFADALAAPGTGRVQALTVAVFDASRDTVEGGLESYDRAAVVVREAVAGACRMGRPFEGTVLVAPDVTEAIARVSAERHPETVLLGMSSLAGEGSVLLLEEILSRTSADVVVLNAPPGWSLDSVRRVLLPVAGRTPHDPLRARLVGMLLRGGERSASLLRILRAGEDREQVERDTGHQAEDLGLTASDCILEAAANALDAILARSADFDLIILGSGPSARRRRILGPFALRVVTEAKCPVVAIAQAPPSSFLPISHA